VRPTPWTGARKALWGDVRDEAGLITDRLRWEDNVWNDIGVGQALQKIGCDRGAPALSEWMEAYGFVPARRQRRVSNRTVLRYNMRYQSEL
jgi:hypothetical protein